MLDQLYCCNFGGCKVFHRCAVHRHCDIDAVCTRFHLGLDCSCCLLASSSRRFQTIALLLSLHRSLSNFFAETGHHCSLQGFLVCLLAPLVIMLKAFSTLCGVLVDLVHIDEGWLHSQKIDQPRMLSGSILLSLSDAQSNNAEWRPAVSIMMLHVNGAAVNCIASCAGSAGCRKTLHRCELRCTGLVSLTLAALVLATLAASSLRTVFIEFPLRLSC